MDGLEAAIADAARALPEGHLDRLVHSLEMLAGPGPTAQAALQGSAAGASARQYADAIGSAWEREPGLSGRALALALRSAVTATVLERAVETIDVAWTGPATPAIPMRRTESILLDLISQCRQELLVVSFAAYKVPEVLDALAEAASRGVQIQLILESAADSGGALTFDAKAAFAALEGRVQFYSWPADQRGPAAGPRGTLHAKAVVADAQRALVTSANLTGNALELNMELGLLVEGGSVPRRLASHFAELIDRGVLLLQVV
jgi:cardiolipin synthase A/B